MTELRCAICGQSMSGVTRYVHGAAVPEELRAWSAQERDRRCRSEGDLVLVDAGARGFVRAMLDLPMRHEDERAIELVVWVELTKGAWRSLQSVEKPGTSAEVAAMLASKIPGIESAIGEHVRVRRTADSARARIVAAGKGKLARLEQPGSLSEKDRRLVEDAIASDVASTLVESFVVERIGTPSARWREPDGDLECVRVDGSPNVYVTVGASATAQDAGEQLCARIELVMQTRDRADDIAPRLLLALTRHAIEHRVALVPGVHIELPGVVVFAGEPSSHLWLSPASVGALRGGPLALGPLHAHLVRVVPLHADEVAWLEQRGAEALARKLEARRLDPSDLGRASALA